MKLYYANGTCSLGIHALMEEIGKPYEKHRVSFANKEQTTPQFLAMNPKGKVPTLQKDDGGVLTEWPAIAAWLARKFPEKNLLPDDADALARVLETTDYVVATVHMRGFSRIAGPQNFTPNTADHDAIKARGNEMFRSGLDILESHLGGRPYVTGALSIADFALFYVEFWAAERLKFQLPAGLAAHYARMKARPSVQAALKDEGYA